MLSTFVVVISLHPGLISQAWDLQMLYLPTSTLSASQPKERQQMQSISTCSCAAKHLFWRMFHKVGNILGQLRFACHWELIIWIFSDMCGVILERCLHAHFHLSAMSLVLSQKTSTVGVQEIVGSSDFCKFFLQLCWPGDSAFYKSGWRATYGHS